MPYVIPPEVATARARLGNATLRGDAAAVAEARRDLAAEKMAAYVARVVAEAPPLRPEQRDRIVALLTAAEVAP